MSKTRRISARRLPPTPRRTAERKANPRLPNHPTPRCPFLYAPPHTHKHHRTRARHSLTWRDTRGTQQEKKKRGSKKEKTSKKSSSPSRGVTFEGSQQASSADKAKEAKE